MKDFLTRVRDNLAHESRTTKATLGAIAFALLVGVVSVVGGITSNLIQANIAQTVVAEPQERPLPPGYETQIQMPESNTALKSENTNEDRPATPAEAEKKPGVLKKTSNSFLNLFN